ncbi:MAG: O-succinylhomoserine sulfhydrylase [gamma proteobacterium symbiont of Bathyaustriella thionipta]|nr:O-succinylhomoserine sulfhydrylase [gamma proteobacterium symbiont of Bathyaustriella thionipta]MCU7951192.1 O-succinylhomoserine sulfhydrylase [gamma proteobacterium symbiont of Bathyaustriella thionipta]MCU7954564.1 O-succinylhomoserine sulfhydrylase [gamma proteobacterium symbiont of Bathyaustriella thionipta]MCU7957696.1 O-succinylhomoserine sulfhydrylase [gamma proteobacterium symbiont of Bathyaustriella thionipta]MCU7967981.1 O-succinylhomoserine sulfhydrylase [gamma proteobacterium sy
MNGDDLSAFEAELGFDTLAIRAGYKRTQEAEHNEAIFPTSSYVYNSAAQAAARFAGDEPGNIYSRFTNPTVRTFEDRLAALEGAESCVATSSGMAAIMSTCLGLLKTGDHIVSSRAIFGSTVLLFNNYMARFGVTTTYVDLTDMNAWEAAIQGNTKLLFLETPSNPLVEIADLTQLAELAHQHDCLLVVDNCLCTPALQKPLAMGADVVIHSATKYLDGQGRGVGGAVLGSKEVVGGEVYGVLRTTGPTMSPFNAWIFLKGLETLNLRMKAHCANAMILAQWLDEHPAVDKVYYPGLESHPGHKLAVSQQSDFGGLLSFELKNKSREQAWQVVDSTRLLSITANLGDVKSTITHPATTTHGRVPVEEREKAGIRDGLLRIAVGLESIEDIQNDLQRGFSGLS